MRKRVYVVSLYRVRGIGGSVGEFVLPRAFLIL